MRSSVPISPSSGSRSIEDVDYEATIAQVQKIVDGYPGLQRDLLTYLRERVKEVLTGASATIVVRIFGPDLDQLTAQAQKVAAAIGKIDGVADLKVQAQVLVPQIEVRYRPEKAQLVGVSPADVRRAATTLVQGTKVGEIYEDQKMFDVVVWGSPEVRDSMSAIRERRACRRPAAESCRSMRRPTWSSRRRPTKLRASADRAASTSRATCAGAISGPSRRTFRPRSAA